jgi:hypothetical protein
MLRHEEPITKAYWESIGRGTLYLEARVVQRVVGDRSWRDLDGVVVLDSGHRIQHAANPLISMASM